MAVILNKTYRIKSYAGNGRNLNVYGNEQVSNNRNVCLWSQDSTANAQKWTLKKSSTRYNKLVTALDNSYALNYNWANGLGNAGNCDIYPEANNDTYSAISFNTVDAANNVYKIKLRNYSLYLTAASNSDGANVTWEANNGTTAQQWKLVEVDEVQSNDNYQYPTDSKKISTEYSSSHPAIDITGTNGVTPIYAFADGIVSWKQTYNGNWHPNNDDSEHNASTMNSMGNAVAINHYNPDSTLVSGEYARTIYMHMYTPCSINEGSFVSKGDIIGYIGNTGRSSAAHLHFCLSVGDLANMKPGEKSWIKISDLPNKNAVETYLPDYHL